MLAAGVARVLRSRRRAKPRVVEPPNSHYSSQLVRDRETRHRWRNLTLDRLHEINREEVERLLAKIESSGLDSLRPNDRLFLDRMAELAGDAPPTRPDPPTDRPTAAGLRQRHA